MVSLAPVRAPLAFIRLVQTDFHEETQADYAQAARGEFGHLLAFLGSNCFLLRRRSASSPQRCLRSQQGSADGQRGIEKVAVQTCAHGALLSVEIGVGPNAGAGVASIPGPFQPSSGSVAFSGGEGKKTM